MRKFLFLFIPVFIIGCINSNPIKELDCVASQSYGENKIKKGSKALGYFINTSTGAVYEKDDTTGKLKTLNGLTKDDLLDYETNSSITNNTWKMEMILTSRFDKADNPYKTTANLDLNTLYFQERNYDYKGYWNENTYIDGYCKLLPTSLSIE
jgi:hypothetical protein